MECDVQPNARMAQAAAAAHAVLEMRYGAHVMTPDPAIGRVLVVDDNAENRALAKAALEDEDVPVVLAATGAEAIAEFSRLKPDMVLLDIRMPGMDGFELVRRARESHPDLRVLFMSGYSREYRLDPERDEFVAKPFRPRELLGCVYEILGRGRG